MRLRAWHFFALAATIEMAATLAYGFAIHTSPLMVFAAGLGAVMWGFAAFISWWDQP